MGRKRASGNERLGEYVQRRSAGNLELRFPLPPDVRAAFPDTLGRPRTQIIRALGTKDIRLANAKADLLRAEIRKQVQAVREAQKSGSLEAYLIWLYDFEVEDFRLQLQREDEERRKAFFSRTGAVAEASSSSKGHRTFERRVHGAALTSDDPDERRAVAGWAADLFFERQGVIPDHNSGVYRTVVDRCAEVLADAVIAKDDIHHGRKPSSPISPALSARQEFDTSRALTPEGRLPLSVYFRDIYCPIEMKAGSKPKGERNIAGKRHSVRLLKELLADRPVCSLSKGELYDFLDKLAAYPDARLLSGELKKLPASAILKKVEAGELKLPPMSPKTANKHVSNVSTVLKLAARRKHIEWGEWTGVKAYVEDASEGAGRSFTTAELNRIFAHPLFAGCAGEHVEGGLFKPGDVLIRDDRFWLPLVFLFTGARSSEAVGLLTTDAVIDHDVPHFLIEPNAVRPRLKNGHSRRMVPIHSRLISAGFLDFVRKRRDEGSARLFPMAEQTTYREGATGASVARSLSSSLILRQFNRTILGQSDARADGGSIKCFRNTFEQESISKIASDEIRQRLTGRRVVSSARIYTENVPYDPEKRLAQLRRLRDDIECITYDAVKLDHLMIKEPKS